MKGLESARELGELKNPGLPKLEAISEALGPVEVVLFDVFGCDTLVPYFHCGG